MTNNIPTIVKQSLPALSGSALTYNPDKNVYLTMGYTSAAGNTYYKALRLSDRLIVTYNLGDGYCHTFLNGITLFCWDGRRAKIIGQRQWGGYNYCIFNERFARQQSIEMLKDYLAGQCKLSGQHVSNGQLLEFSRSLIDDTCCKQLV